MQKPLSTEMVGHIQKDLRAGKTQRQIADERGVSTGSVANVRSRMEPEAPTTLVETNEMQGDRWKHQPPEDGRPHPGAACRALPHRPLRVASGDLEGEQVGGWRERRRRQARIHAAVSGDGNAEAQARGVRRETGD